MLKEESKGLVCDFPDTAAAFAKLLHMNLVFSLARHLEAFPPFPPLSHYIYMNVWPRRDFKEQRDTLSFFKINLVIYIRSRIQRMTGKNNDILHFLFLCQLFS